MTRSFQDIIETVVTNRVSKNKVQLLHSEKLGKLAWLVHAFSTRHGGVSRVYGGQAPELGLPELDPRAGRQGNREIFHQGMDGPARRSSVPVNSLPPNPP